MLSAEDLHVLCCPKCNGDLKIITEGLSCDGCGAAYPVINGIPRFTQVGKDYNASWDYKWWVLDGGKGCNFEVIDKNSYAYRIHNVFRFFEDDKAIFPSLPDSGNKIAVDIGCGIGQYSISLLEKGISKIYSVDMTRGVDIGQKLVHERFPQYKDRIVFIQGDARHLPLKTGAVDLGMALASIHHSGFLDDCIKEVVRVTKPQHRFFIWIYAKPLMPIGDKYRSMVGWFKLTAHLCYYSYIELIFNVLKKMPNAPRVLLLKIMASQFVVVLRRIPLIGRFVRFATPGMSDHPDKGYRLINLYDAYSPSFAEASDESDVIRWSRTFGFKLLSFSSWRLGFIGEKD